jgi:hypothetical protein
VLPLDSSGSCIIPGEAEHLHKCDEGQVSESVYDEDVVLLSYNDQAPFLEILNVPHEHLPSEILEVTDQVMLDTFVDVANTMAKFMRDLRECVLLRSAPLSLLTFIPLILLIPICRFCQ